MKTCYFTFGQDHIHKDIKDNNFIYDKDVVVKITSENPRETMFKKFGSKWSFQYNEKPNMEFFPRGIKELKIKDEKLYAKE